MAGSSEGIQAVGEAGDIYRGDGCPCNLDGDRLGLADCGEWGTVDPGTASLGDAGRIVGEGIVIGEILLRFTFVPFTVMGVLSRGLNGRDLRVLGLVTNPFEMREPLL
uniref:Uncharacterized protein n=1 Tax=Pithovirus LCPAC304 TaxID=2506594 RepID=A0A481Z948_9VIRU|nr:MAG: hypothetical protein LCPAC304_02430 [Pithovirus LCPAC304]